MKRILLMSFLLIAMNSFGQTKSNSNTVSFKTSAVCGMCKQRIERDLSLTKGVTDAKLDLSTKVVTVQYNSKKTSSEIIQKAITKIGYDADEMVAVQKSHDALPACCQKTAMAHKD